MDSDDDRPLVPDWSKGHTFEPSMLSDETSVKLNNQNTHQILSKDGEEDVVMIRWCVFECV